MKFRRKIMKILKKLKKLIELDRRPPLDNLHRKLLEKARKQHFFKNPKRNKKKHNLKN